MNLNGVFSMTCVLWDNYDRELEKNPMMVKAFTALMGCALGGISVIYTPYRRKSTFWYERLFRAAAFGFGFLITGTISQFFYNALDATLPGTDGGTVVLKVVIDQVLWTPLAIVIVFALVCITSGYSSSEIITTIKINLVTNILGVWCFMPLFQFINFGFVATEHRLVYIDWVRILTSGPTRTVNQM